jgi:choline dehydrogenase
MLKGHGPYKVAGLAAGAIKSSSVSGGDEDLFLFGGPLNFTGFFPGYSQKPAGDFKNFTWDILKVHLRNNAGTVKLQSKSQYDSPEINFNIFTKGHHGDTENDPDHDLTAMAQAVVLARKFFEGVRKPIGPLSKITPSESANKLSEIKKTMKNEAFSHQAISSCPTGAMMILWHVLTLASE